jgi:3-oxoadipate enol-lactonase
MPKLTTGEVTLHYQFDVKPGKPVLMLSNSLGTTLSMWDQQAPKFAEHFSLLHYDTRGHGQSSVPAGPYTIEQLGRDALALLDELKIEQANFCGISMGGMTGIWMAIHAPQRIKALVLSDTGALVGGPEFWNMVIDTARKGMDVVGPMMMPGWFTENFIKTRPDIVNPTLAMMQATPLAGFVACCEAIREMDQRADVAKIKAPTLVTYGRHDVATPPELSKFLLAQIPGAEEWTTNAAHLSNQEDPETFTQGVLNFLHKHN